MDENKTTEPQQDAQTKRILTMLIVSAILVGGGVLTPVMANLGFMDDLSISLSVGNIIAAGTGIIMGVVISRTFFSPLPKYFLNMFICTMYTVGTFWACYGYSFFRKTLWKIELVIPFGVGLLPVVLYLFIKAKIEGKNRTDRSDSDSM